MLLRMCHLSRSHYFSGNSDIPLYYDTNKSALHLNITIQRYNANSFLWWCVKDGENKWYILRNIPSASGISGKNALDNIQSFLWPNLPKVHPLDTHHPSTLIYWNNSVTWHQSNRNNTTRFRFYYKCIKIILSSYLLLCCVSVKTPLKFVCTVLHIMNHIKKSVKI